MLNEGNNHQQTPVIIIISKITIKDPLFGSTLWIIRQSPAISSPYSKHKTVHTNMFLCLL
jgi:hypothetical protein